MGRKGKRGTGEHKRPGQPCVTHTAVDNSGRRLHAHPARPVSLSCVCAGGISRVVRCRPLFCERARFPLWLAEFVAWQLAP